MLMNKPEATRDQTSYSICSNINLRQFLNGIKYHLTNKHPQYYDYEWGCLNET